MGILVKSLVMSEQWMLFIMVINRVQSWLMLIALLCFSWLGLFAFWLFFSLLLWLNNLRLEVLHRLAVVLSGNIVLNLMMHWVNNNMLFMSLFLLMLLFVKVKSLTLKITMVNLWVESNMSSTRCMMRVFMRLSPVMSWSVRSLSVVSESVNAILLLFIVMNRGQMLGHMSHVVSCMTKMSMSIMEMSAMHKTVKRWLIVVTVSMIVSMEMIVAVSTLKRLHLDDKIAATSVYITWVENTAVGLKSTTCLMPATAIKSVEIIAPVELKLVDLLVISENFNIIVEHIPRHIDWIETLAP